MRTLTLTLTLIALSFTLTLTACPNPPAGDTYVTYEGDTVTNPEPWYWDLDHDGFGGWIYYGADNPRGRDDVSQTNGDCDDSDNTIYPSAPEICDDLDNDCDGNIDEDNCPASDDDDSAAETVEMAFDFFVNFSSSGLNRIQTSLPGAESQFVEYDLVVVGEPFATASIPELSIQIVHKTNLLDFDPWDIEPVDAYIEVCWVEDAATGAELMEPSSVSPVNNQMLIPSSTLEVSLDEDGYGSLRLVVACLFAEEEVEENMGFAVLIGTNGLTVVDDQGVEHAFYPDPDNGSIFNPVSQVWLQPNVEPADPSLTVSLNAASPSGMVVPAWQDVLRFHVCASNTDAEIENIRFTFVSTDNAETNWNTCGELGDVENFAFYNLADVSQEVTAGYSFYDLGGGNCSDSADWNSLWSVNLLVSNEVVAEGTCSTYELWANLVGANAAMDDAVQVSILAEAWFLWEDSDGNAYDGTGIGLPIIGGNLTF